MVRSPMPGLLLVGLLAAPALVASAESLVVHCRGQVTFTVAFDLDAKTVMYVNSSKSYELTRVDDTYLEWGEGDAYGVSVNSLHRPSGHYTETFTHWSDGRKDLVRAMCTPAQDNPDTGAR